MALGPLHDPAASGVPPRAANKSLAGLLMQSVSAPSLPAFGGACTATVTELDTFTQGGGTVMVYM
jgi:hypothetical protein